MSVKPLHWDSQSHAESSMPLHITPRTRMLLKDKAYESLKKQILGGDLRPGHFLSERRVATELGMSKTPVREALERLMGEQFVSVSPQQGYVVRGCSIRDVAEHFEFRLTLEPFFLRQSARNLTLQQGQILSSQLENQQAALIAGDMERAIELDAEFHLMFARFAGNREMLRAMSRLCERMFRFVAQVFELDAARFAKNYQEHCRIADAVLARDGDQAAALLTDHLEHCRTTLLMRASNIVENAEMADAL